MKFFTSLILALLKIIIFEDHAEGLGSEGIIGGLVAELGNFEYQVALHYNKRYVCEGGLINENSVITSMSCLIDEDTGKLINELLSVLFSLNSLHPQPWDPRINVDKVYFLKDFMRADWDPDKLYSAKAVLTVLELAQSWKLYQHVVMRSLELPEENNLYTNHTFVVAGHGINKMTILGDVANDNFMVDGTTDGKLRYIETQGLTNDECGKLYENTFFESNMCARAIPRSEDSPVGACMGDNGSPLVYNNVLVGVLIGGPLECDESLVPAVYLRVSNYLSFIRAAMKGIKTSDMLVFQLNINAWGNYEFVEIQDRS